VACLVGSTHALCTAAASHCVLEYGLTLPVARWLASALRCLPVAGGKMWHPWSTGRTTDVLSRARGYAWPLFDGGEALAALAVARQMRCSNGSDSLGSKLAMVATMEAAGVQVRRDNLVRWTQDFVRQATAECGAATSSLLDAVASEREQLQQAALHMRARLQQIEAERALEVQQRAVRVETQVGGPAVWWGRAHALLWRGVCCKHRLLMHDAAMVAPSTGVHIADATAWAHWDPGPSRVH
jgi:hypothetical protein